MALDMYAKYRAQSVMTMTQGEMVVKLFEGVEKQLNIAIVTIDEKNFAGANTALQKSQRILRHLMGTLDMQYPVSHNLYSLYEYFIFRIIDANVKKDTKNLKEVLPMIGELRDSFSKAEKLSRMN